MNRRNFSINKDVQYDKSFTPFYNLDLIVLNRVMRKIPMGHLGVELHKPSPHSINLLLKLFELDFNSQAS